jgi:hypothetical protein
VPRFEFPRELDRDRLPTRLGPLAVAHEQRLPFPVEVNVAPLDGYKLGSAKPSEDQRKEHEAVALHESRSAPARVRRAP